MVTVIVSIRFIGGSAHSPGQLGRLRSDLIITVDSSELPLASLGQSDLTSDIIRPKWQPSPLRVSIISLLVAVGRATRAQGVYFLYSQSYRSTGSLIFESYAFCFYLQRFQTVCIQGTSAVFIYILFIFLLFQFQIKTYICFELNMSVKGFSLK